MKFRPILKDFTNRTDYQSVDLSAKTLQDKAIDVSDHNALTQYLKEIQSQKQAKVLYGGYLEKRSLYDKKSLFKDKSSQRNIHLGVDFWAEASEEIIAPLEGIVHSFKDNKELGNYGPCIILKHLYNNQIVHALYGHLSRESLIGLQIGQTIEKNQVFCSLGNPTENGGYVPHLHFQLIKDIDNYYGDYPGVCHQDNLDFFKSNTISPLKFLGL